MWLREERGAAAAAKRRSFLMNSKCLVITSVLVASSIAQASDRVISVAPDAPNSLLDAVVHAQPGDTIRIAPGTYHLTKTVALEVTGTEAQPVRIESQGPGRAVLDFADEPEEKNANGI